MNPFQHPLVQSLFNELPRDEIAWLLFPKKHMALLSTRRAAMIISRVRLIAALFAVLTLLFIIPDLLILPWSVSSPLAAERIITSLSFAALALAFKESTRLRDAYIALGILFFIPTVFFVASYTLLSQVEPHNLSAIIMATYSFLPLVMVAGLSMFPLTVMEGVIFAAPVLIAEALSAWTNNTQVLNLNPVISTIWMALLITIVAILSGMSQLGFMIALVRMAIRDTLTRCFSRSSGVELLEIQFILASRSNSPLAIAFIDLDDFKSVNDTFGHEAGDQVLLAAAEGIRTTLRTGDMLVRWGGEEFILIMPNTFCNDAVAAIERLRSSGLGVRPDNQKVTASIGISERSEDKIADWKTLVEMADKRMYLAKQGGKNKVVFSCSRI
ncbi:MAG: GGDEF domain-containing protein [Gallionellaceae bacterium]|nr:GGDEF domain-containing protein [Gallionellaceae bacterium]